ncbi:MAG: anti-sigma factor family protein [Gemmatimonadales bacterium]
MHCKDFLEQYSAYRDRLVPELKAAMEAHLEICPSCHAYDRAVRLGVETLRENRVQISAGFEESLRARLERGEVEEQPYHPQLAAVPATATVLLLLALLTLALRREPAVSTATAQANPPAVARPHARGGIPFVAFVPNP